MNRRERNVARRAALLSGVRICTVRLAEPVNMRSGDTITYNFERKVAIVTRFDGGETFEVPITVERAAEER